MSNKQFYYVLLILKKLLCKKDMATVITFMSGDTESPDDVIRFLNVSGINPIIVMSLNAAFVIENVRLKFTRTIK